MAPRIPESIKAHRVPVGLVECACQRCTAGGVTPCTHTPREKRMGARVIIMPRDKAMNCFVAGVTGLHGYTAAFDIGGEGLEAGPQEPRGPLFSGAVALARGLSVRGLTGGGLTSGGSAPRPFLL